MARMPKLVSKSFQTPKGCVVRSVTLDPDRREARVGYDCGDGGRGTFPLPRGEGFSVYPSAIVKGVRSVRVPGSTVSGKARIGFVLSPRYVTCRKRAGDLELACQVHTDTGVISGSRRGRKR